MAGRSGGSNWTRRRQSGVSLRRLDGVETLDLIWRHRWTDLGAGVAQDAAFAAARLDYSWHDWNRKERQRNRLLVVALSLVV